ncbi:hypothetical protein [Micromonospora sp. NBC_01813]|uniref:hypothetical protein n=1 Tax=Micromonospora sp. NBC_01813 TaxID=2975988 RepID=UPI002DDC7F99|nr:hypothetical protein [Micromonospora sp. NBC_01813]WSA09504.1 hypothetical protein OG958_01330 [Micromonospora sp. NBC_01813]
MLLPRIARITAVLIGLGTFVFLFVGDSWRADNPFLVPDLVLSAALLGAAALPGRIAAAPLLAAHCLAAGVLSVSVATYAVDGRIGIASLLGLLGAVVTATLLIRLRPEMSA